MSMPIVHHVRTKSQTKGSARTFCLDLAIYANDCCGVAWPSDAKLYQGANVSRQRIHELKHVLMGKGELIILARPGHTNLYFMAAYGQPLGPQGEYLTTKRGQHEPDCAWRREVSELSDPSLTPWVSGLSDPHLSDPPDTPCQRSLTQQQEKTREKTPETVALSREDRLARATRLTLTPGSRGWLDYVGDD